MRISYRFLQHYIDLKDISVHEVAEALTMLGIEVESVYDLGMVSGNILVARIEKIDPHPNADKLTLCTVDAGKRGVFKVVCGATNINPGDVVPLALPGAVLPNGTVLRKARIRGVESEGMLCSGAELGWNDDATGILILPESLPVGEPFDALLEITITPNRPDCLNMVGIARELSARFRRPLHLPVPRFNEITTPADSLARVSITAWEGCPRYTARIIRHIKVRPSPRWLVHFLESAGLRSINNVVDATNFVLLELGHPLHAFDMDKLAEHQIIVRWAKDGEQIETLDGVKRTLTAGDLVITDPQKVVALAGIMGCGNSEISDSTVNVLLECAYFTPATIRRTAKRLEMQTEASYRFERGTDREKMTLALDRATELIKELAGGEVAKGFIDTFTPWTRPHPVSVEINKVTSLLGIELNGREIADNLARLGFELVSSDRERLRFNIPSHRVDISRDVDLIEEVARIFGYEKIPVVLPYIQSVPAELSLGERIEKILSKELVGMGFCETINYSFVSTRQVRELGFPADDLVGILNPISRDQDVMRPSLIIGLINNFIHNLNRDVYNVRLFEIGSSYHWDSSAEDGYKEPRWLVAGMCGSVVENWLDGEREVNFFDIKGVAENLLSALGIKRYNIERVKQIHWLHPGKSAQFVARGERICWFGEFHPALSSKLGIEQRLYLLEMPLGIVEKVAELRPTFKELPRYPATRRDFAFIVDEEVASLQIERSIRQIGKELVENVTLFDVYRGEQIPAGKKSLAYAVTFRAPDHTLTDAEVNTLQEKIISTLKKQLGITLR